MPLLASVAIDVPAPPPPYVSHVALAAAYAPADPLPPPPVPAAADAPVAPVSAAPVAPASTAPQPPQSDASPGDTATQTKPATPTADDTSAIVVTARFHSAADPVEKLNVASFQAVQAVDDAVIAPVTHAYNHVLPEPVRDGISNALNNLDEPIVFLNFLLQLKPGKAIETLGRFIINSTLGVAGLFDVAKKKPFNLPRRSNGLADTLAYYGVGPGPYLFLPLIGATTLRDALARPFDLALLPFLVPKPFGNPYVALGKGTLNALVDRDENDKKLKQLRATEDPYVSMREEYLARRRAEIEVLKGKRKSIYDPPYFVMPKARPDATDTNEVQPQTNPAPAQPQTSSAQPQVRPAQPIAPLPLAH